MSEGEGLLGLSKSPGSLNEKRTTAKKHKVVEGNKGSSSVQLDAMKSGMGLPPNAAPTQTFSSSLDVPSNDKSQRLAESDRSQLLSILPEEVWLLIFKNLENSPDLEPLSNSSLCFRELLLPQRTKFLFHNVCKILGETFPRLEDTPEDNEVDEQTVRNWCNQMIKLRLVSRTWSTAVDNFFQNHPVHYNLYTRGKNEFMQCFLYSKYFIFTPHDQQQRPARLLRHFAESHTPNTNRNPFLSRWIHIEFNTGDPDDFANEIRNVLWCYGTHIWYCSICIHDYPFGSESYFNILESLALMPNLTVLELYVSDEFIRNPSAMELGELQFQIDLRPLPTLQKLQMLVVCDLPSPTFTELIRRNAHVSRLHLPRSKSRYLYEITTVGLPNLKILDIAFYSAAEFLGMDCDLVNWSLTELRLDLGKCSDFIEWPTVFRFLEKKFKTSLAQLKIALPVAHDKIDKDKLYREAHTFKLNLPHMKKLFVQLEYLACLDFVLPMKESITFFQIYMHVTDHENIIRPLEKAEAGRSRILKLLSCVRRPSKSNVWELFPNLEVVLYTVCSSKVKIECHYVNTECWIKEESIITPEESDEND